MRSIDKDRLRREIKAITESAIRETADAGKLPEERSFGLHHVCPRRLNPNLVVDRLFLIVLVALLTPL